MESSQSNVTENTVSPADMGVIVVTHFSKYAGFPSFPRNPLAEETCVRIQLEKTKKIIRKFLPLTCKI